MIIQAVVFHIFPVVFVGLTLLFLIKITVPVGIKIQKSSSCLQYTDPLSVSNIRMLQIPGKISGNDHVKGIILKIQLLCIHPQKADIPAKISCIFLCLFQHSFRIIHCIYMISGFCQDHRKKSGACSDIQDTDLFLGFVRELAGQHLKPCVFLGSRKLFMIHFGVPFCTGAPVRFDFIEKFFHVDSSALFYSREGDQVPHRSRLMYQIVRVLTSPWGGFPKLLC